MRPLVATEAAVRQARRARNVTGVWRQKGTSPQRQDVATALILLEREGMVQGTATDARGYVKGKAVTLTTGERVIRGYFGREDGRRGAFAWVVKKGGGEIQGHWKTVDGSQGIWTAIKQGDEVPQGLWDFLKKRRWQASKAPALAGLTYGRMTVAGQSVKVPTGYAASLPGGGKLAVGRGGITAKPPSVEKIIEEVTGGASKPSKRPTASAPASGADVVKRSDLVLKVTVGAAGAAALLGLAAWLWGR